MITLKDQPRYRLVSNVIIFAAFLLTAQIGTYLYREMGTSPSMVWAPVGIAIAAVILEGYSVWPSIALASLVNTILNDTPPLLAIGSVLGNTIQPLVAYFFLKNAGLNRKLNSVKDMFLILATAMFLTMIVPTVNTFAVYLYNHIYELNRASYWTSWWTGGAMSALILTPFLIRWLRHPIAKRTTAQTLEICVALTLVCITSYFLFSTIHVSIGGFSLIYLLFALFLWISFRTDSRIMTLALLLMTVISIMGALYGTYVPAEGGLSRRIFSTQVFDLILGVIFFILVSLEEQRKQAVAVMKEKNENLELAMTRIRQNDETKNEFIATLAHELRNPLAAFLSSVEIMLLGKDTNQSEIKSLAEMMQGRVKTMGRLLDDLLDISRVDRGQMHLKRENVDLKKIVTESIQAVKAMIKEHQHSFSASLPMEEVKLYADPVRLEQIIINLLTNAVKYTPNGGKIELSGKYEEGWVSISVKDTGIGIPPHMLNRIFESFVQVKEGSKTSSGLGIGLALSKSLVEMHGGTIIAKSEGKGSEFIVRLPAYLDEPEVKEEFVSNIKEDPKNLHILVVDDNVEAAKGISKLLSFRGHKTAMAHNGQRAIEYIAEEKPDVALMDIGLPDMDGYEVATKIRNQEWVPTLIAVTGYGQIEDREKAKQAGFDHHLTKPVGLADIEALLN